MLDTRVPRRLRKRVRVFCVEQDKAMMTFVTEAIRERLRHRGKR